ncbi:lysozyme inhibitor LprI family protein [Paraburkholderia acidicola]|nr:hypothetical protein [Paraburkholderia acidicola]
MTETPSTSYAARALRLMVAVSLLGVVFDMPIAHSAQDQAISGPSFLCGSAGTAIERMICSDPELAARDRTMATLFAASHTDALGGGMSQQQSLQRKWLKTRSEECSKGEMRSCLLTEYDARFNELAVAALFQAPDVALTELARESPKSAPLYEAIYRYATIEDKVDRVKSVENLIEPAFNEFHDKPWAEPMSDVADAHEAASSDENFSAFLDVASIGNHPLTMPCSALVRRPGLIEVLDAAYGGAIDNQLLWSDCEAMTPKLETVDRLTKAAVSAQPFCPGTIRFSLARSFEKTLVAVRLHRTDLWRAKNLDVSPTDQDESNDDPKQDVDESHFFARHPASIRQAIDELAKYYTAHFDVPSALAREQAAKAVSAIIFGAYDLCEWG